MEHPKKPVAAFANVLAWETFSTIERTGKLNVFSRITLFNSKTFDQLLAISCPPCSSPGLRTNTKAI
jgi:hypothetical protein